MTKATLGRVLVTTPSFGAYSTEPMEAAATAGLELVRATAAHPLNAQELRDEMQGFDAVITGLDRITDAVLEAVPGIRVVAKHGAGYDNIDVDAVERAGAEVVYAPGANADAVADLTMGLMIASGRQVLQADSSLRRGEWGRFNGPQLRGKTLGIIGLGKIGSRVAARARAFGMRIIATDPGISNAQARERGAEAVELEELVATSDVISLHCPYVPGEPPLLDAALLATTKPGVGVINAARGGLVDESALARLLHDRHVAFAAVDALASEPPPADDPMLHAPNTILTPHIGAYADGANAAMGVMVVEEIARVLKGESPINPVRGTGIPERTNS